MQTRVKNPNPETERNIANQFRLLMMRMGLAKTSQLTLLIVVITENFTEQMGMLLDILDVEKNNFLALKMGKTRH